MRGPTITWIGALVGVCLIGIVACDGGGGDGSSSGDTPTAEDTATAEDVVAGEGTWLDDASGLLWQSPPADGKKMADAAATYCDELSLGGYDDWRLPTVGELRTLIGGCDATAAGGSCNIDETGDCVAKDCRDDSCDGCAMNGGPADGCFWPVGVEGTCHFYWTSTGVEGSPTYNWTVQFQNANVTNAAKMSPFNLRCVR